MNEAHLEQFVTILSSISYTSWNEIVKKDPEWKYLQKFRNIYGYGKFNVFLMMTGLNAYQLKGTAEENYWSILGKHIEKYNVPRTLKDLQKLLTDFYEKERLPKGKLKRLETFLSSKLAKKLWVITPEEIGQQFQFIWLTLAETMNQKQNAKTICFAMKCLGISLYIQEYNHFDFSTIPIPVDSRIEKFTHKITNDSSDNIAEIQHFWNMILMNIQKNKPLISMIHLDSLIWQSGLLDADELKHYFTECDSQMVGINLVDFFNCI